MRILSLVSDAFGGYGGISQFNRAFSTAISVFPELRELVVLPRQSPFPVGSLPPRTIQRPPPKGKIGYLGTALREACSGFDVVLCGHLNLLPAAALAARAARRGRRKTRLALVIHGVEAWEKRPVPGLSAVDLVISVSSLTLERFLSWSRLPESRGTVLPNTVDLASFIPAPRPEALRRRYGLPGNGPVVMGMGRIDAGEQGKGFNEMLAALPLLASRHPGLRYLFCGDGSGRRRLEEESRRLGLSEHVLLPGFIDEAEKADHYRLADIFVLCGREEGFGIVLLEAMACGVPVVASKRDGSREAVLDGRIGELADPDDPGDIAAAIQRILDAPPPRRPPPELAAAFGPESFARRTSEILALLG